MTPSPARPLLTTTLCTAMQAVGGGLGWSLLPATMPLVARDLGLTQTQGGVVWGAASLGIALAAPAGGAAVDRFGARPVAGAAMLVGALACAARALAVDATTLAATMFLFGLHVGFVAPAIPKALAGHVPLSRLGRANGLALVGYTLGTALTVATGATVLVPALGGWRAAMVLAAVAMALVGVAWLVIVRDRVAPSHHAGIFDSLRLARDGQMRRVAAMHFLLFGGYLALLGYLPRALVESGMEPSGVGAAVASWLVVAGVANFAGPALSDRLGRRRPLLVGGALLASLGLGALALAHTTSILPFLALAAAGGGCFAPLLLSLPLEMEGVGPARAGAALGLLMLVGQAGGFLMPIVVGAAAEGGGFVAAMALLAVAHGLVALPALGLRETGSAAAVPVTAAVAGGAQ